MNFVQIRSFDNYVTANIQLSLLQDEGINCYLKDEYTLTIDPLLSPAIGGIKLMVYELQAERAESILKDAEKKFLQTIPCPDCGNHSLEKIVQVKTASNLSQKLLFMLVNGAQQEVKTFFVCAHCKSVFNEMPLDE
ncbi:MAG: DUF2007 domain-containing protein [Bacteroidetes bacterium]|nr:DUF2007 domain-containing protein [Bacteroidota bacterium]